ncbi:hypothetical protein Hanom_Chr12g01108991 [Helianthus anomalus]
MKGADHMGIGAGISFSSSCTMNFLCANWTYILWQWYKFSYLLSFELLESSCMASTQLLSFISFWYLTG